MWNCGSNRDEVGSEGIKAVRTEAWGAGAPALGAAQEPGSKPGPGPAPFSSGLRTRPAAGDVSRPG